MRPYLLDTNVLSEVVRKHPQAEVIETLRAIPASDLYTSSICVTELRYGTQRHPQGDALWNRLSQEVLSRVQVLPIGEAEAIVAGDLMADLANRGLAIGLEDVLIAATALGQDLTVATRNVRHFERVIGLRVECWWP